MFNSILCLTRFIFRVIRDFCIQAGDPTGTGRGGESIYGCVHA